VVSEPRRLRLTVATGEGGDRLDRWLGARLADEGVTRSAAMRLCDEGLVRLRGAPMKGSAKVREGDAVDVEIPPPAPVEAVAEDIPLTVVFEDAHLLVIDKPAGMVVHPSRGHVGGTLVNAVLHHAEVDDDDADPLRPGIVHRIDRLTSGLLVVAKTPAAREELLARFKSHDIHRVYLALAQGTVAAGTYDTFHDRHPTERLRFTSRGSTGRRAVTHVAPVEVLAGGNATLLRCTLETGRTHQIRVHLTDHGHPLLGDPMYGRRSADARVEAVSRALGRQALHAAELGFAHPITGETLRFESALPEDFAAALARLRG
jgi:23S rRNA pseudouridine1911/1915/1917 synthase